MLLFLAAMAWAPAHATTYLCGLTQNDVESVITYYSLDGQFSDYEPFISLPFDCGTYGDLCNDLGSDRAKDYVCNVWSDAVAQEATTTIASNAMSDWEAKEAAWFDERFPDGIGSSHPWWGRITVEGVTPPPASCSPTETKENSAGTRRVRAKAGFNLTGVFNNVYLSGKAQKKKYILGIPYWDRDSSASVFVDGDAWGVEDTYSDYCDESMYDYDASGKAYAQEWFVGITSNFWEWSEGYAKSTTYGLTTEDVCKRSPWNLVDCL